MRLSRGNRWGHLGELSRLYIAIKRALDMCGFGEEIAWQATVDPSSVSETDFLSETAWVILSAGMSAHVVESRFHPISQAFFCWENAAVIADNSDQCREEALAWFNHRGKVDAIISVAFIIQDLGFERVKDQLSANHLEFLQTLPFIGPVTSKHLAKNLGFPISKPDRHLVRIAEAFGYESVDLMCKLIAETTGEQEQVVDIVLWRFASLDPGYLDFFRDLECDIGKRPSLN